MSLVALSLCRVGNSIFMDFIFVMSIKVFLCTYLCKTYWIVIHFFLDNYRKKGGGVSILSVMKYVTK